MRKPSKQMLIITWILALLPPLAVALLYARLPAQIPTHWDIGGAVTYGPKATLWLIGLLSPALTALLLLAPKIDPRKKNYEKFQGYYQGFILVMAVFMGCVTAIVLSESLSPGRISVGRVVSVGVGLLLAFLGNLMPKVKNNFFMGIRTPWTLSDPDVWNRTHRLGGRLFFWFGLAVAVSGALLPEEAAFALLMAGVLAVSSIPALMSYLWYRRARRDEVP